MILFKPSNLFQINSHIRRGGNRRNPSSWNSLIWKHAVCAPSTRWRLTRAGLYWGPPATSLRQWHVTRTRHDRCPVATSMTNETLLFLTFSSRFLYLLDVVFCHHTCFNQLMLQIISGIITNKKACQHYHYPGQPCNKLNSNREGSVCNYELINIISFANSHKLK